jgi:hypothetical protein
MGVLCTVSTESTCSCFESHGGRRQNCSDEQLPPEDALPWQEEYSRSTREPRIVLGDHQNDVLDRTEPPRLHLRRLRSRAAMEMVGRGREKLAETQGIRRRPAAPCIGERPAR